MLTLSPTRKNKVNLADYHFAQDIENRILMSDFNTFDIEVLEEILYSPLKISLKKLLRLIDIEENKLLSSLEKLSKAGLLTLQDDAIFVDKEKRKYFETQIQRFDSDFKPDMEFVQEILKKVPIHILPNWYAIPRTSNNIFESIVEKYLLTPQIFQRYLSELNLNDPVLNGIIEDLFKSSEFSLSSTEIIQKYNLTREEFEEAILTLEFNFVACLCYQKNVDHFSECVTPFHEWREYLLFIKNTESPTISDEEQIKEVGSSDFAFLEEISNLLEKAKNGPIPSPSKIMGEKLALLSLAEYKEGKIKTTSSGICWLDLSFEDRALTIYRHPQHTILSLTVSDRFIREAEKSIKRVLHGKWVYFDEFIKGALVPLSEHSVIALKKEGKHWRYTQPIYSETEVQIIKATIFEWLYELGMVRIGKCVGRDCFAVTHFGRFFFND